MFPQKQVSLYLIIMTLGALAFFAHEPVFKPTNTKPLPTEHTQSPDAESRNKIERRQWMAEMHRAAPDVDWKAMEVANGKHRQELRNLALTSENRNLESRWTETGSRNQAGRMHAVALSASGNHLYGGSSRGGVWEGSLWGNDWQPLSDNLYGGAHGLAVAGGINGAPEVITAITDNGMVNFTEDGGATWQKPAGLPAVLNEAKRVAHDLSDPNRVYLMLRPSQGMILYRSEDAGRSYTQINSLGLAAGDFWIDRVMGGDIYILRGNRLSVSYNQGNDWSVVGTIAQTSISQVVLTASEAGAPTFYAAAKTGSSWKLHSSINAGADWVFKYDINDFWSTFCASITDRNLILFGGVELWRSSDGGSSFFMVNNWWEYYSDPLNKLHADLPGLDCVMTDTGESFFIATDGGLYRSDDGVTTVTNISLTGLGVSQYYDTHTSINNPDLIIAGAQDQGYQRSNNANGNLPREFEQLISGDYGHITSGDGSHNIVYSVYPGFVLVQSGELNPTLPGMLDFPSGETHSWIPYILANPDNVFEFYLCASHLYKGRWAGGDNVTYTQSAQNFAVDGSSYLTAVSISSVNHNNRLAVTNTGGLWYSLDGGDNWTNSENSGPSAHYFYGTALIHSNVDSRVAWVGGSGYSGPAVYETRDGGQTWNNMSERLPATLVYDLALESIENEVLYAATEAGPYRLNPDTERWEYIGGTEAPLTTYWSVESVPADQLIRFGTYGRGIWDYGVASPVSSVENSAPKLSSMGLENFPNPFNPQTTIRFNLERDGLVQVDVFDLSGKHIRKLHSGSLAKGGHDLSWNGKTGDGLTCPSAVYFVTVKACGKTESLRVTLAK